MITPNTLDAGFATYFQITSITGGTLFQNDGVTPITNGAFITRGPGSGRTEIHAGGQLAERRQLHRPGIDQRHDSAVSAGRPPPPRSPSILLCTVPSVTNATTTENTQTTSGLVITPNAADTAFVTYFQITNITGGTLYQHDGVTPIANGTFITAAQGAAGLKFTPATNSTTSGSFTVQESTTPRQAGLGGPTATATITVNLAQPAVGDQCRDDGEYADHFGLVITPNAADTAFVTYFQITNITGGTLYQNDGVTADRQWRLHHRPPGAAGLKFTPTANRPPPAASRSRNRPAPRRRSRRSHGHGHHHGQPGAQPAFGDQCHHVDNTQTTSGLVITPNAADTAFVTYFQITNITGGTLYQNDGVTAIANGDFISVAQGAAGLKFTPTANSLSSGSFTVQESTTASTSGRRPHGRGHHHGQFGAPRARR